MSQAYAAVFAVILLHLFKLSVVLCNVSSRPARAVVGCLIAVSLLLTTPDLYRESARSLNVHMAGVCAVAAMCIIYQSFAFVKKPPSLSELGFAVFNFSLQNPPNTDRNSEQDSGAEQPQTDNSRKAAFRDFMDTLLRSCLLYPLHDAIITAVKCYPYATLSKQSFAFRSLHSYAFGVALFLTFKIGLEPIIAWFWVLYPEGRPNSLRHFDRPWVSTSLQELWARRWHQMFRSSFQLVAYRPLCALLRVLRGRVKAAAPDGKHPLLPAIAVLQRVLPVYAVFLLSGLVHEYMNWAGLGRTTGHQLAFFAIHGSLLLAEGAACAAAPRAARGVPWWAKTAAIHAIFLATAPVFNEPWLRADYHMTFWHPVQMAGPLLLPRLGLACSAP